VDSSGRLLRLESTASAIRRHLAYQ
jgi:hypothetical protein